MHQQQETTPALSIPLLVVLPTAFLMLANSFYHDLHSLVLVHTPLGPWLLPLGAPVVLTVLLALAVRYAMGLGRYAVLSLAVGFAFCWFVLFNFRGPLYWHGLFDLADRSAWAAYAWIPASWLLGYVAFWVRLPSAAQSRSSAVFLSLGCLSIVYAWVQALLGDDVYSGYPLTMHLALTALALVVVLVALVVNAKFPELWEEATC